MGVLNRIVNNVPGLAEWCYYTSRFPKLGLMRDDTIRMDTDVTKEARSRLPKQVAAERHFRISRALLLDARQQILPKEEWMTFEKDKPYMLEFVRQVQAERQEQTEYETKLYTYKSSKPAPAQ
ncbi:cytochrome b-c1 complex subunit 7-like [Mercenaria mercenaria]|uniref:cytochrome b-c1 complex subunit 7-like n=1 Tax=Mercenaria mercenaria TaxID=6596 RepID=UPI001E1DA563|nr:cytochrome b-c1 complex subunit 7-like [Mercenaria mercenaria]